MRRTYSSIIILFVGLAFNSIKSQSFFDAKDLSFTASYGYGKILYYVDHTPSFIGAADQEAAEYSPSWSIKLKKSFWLNNRFDFSFGLSHITITEKTHQTAKPDWFGFNEKHLSQGFIHLIPSLHIKLPDNRFLVNLGLRLGSVNFIGNSFARQSSNSFGSLHADIALDCGFSVMLSKRFYMDVDWIHGLSRYDYEITSPYVFEFYFKYHSFQTGIRYIIRHAKKA